jgi:hypothetical protein
MFEPIKATGRLINVDKLNTALERQMRSLTADLQRRCANYEAPPSPARYKRTNTLKKSWSRKTYYKAGMLVGEVMSSGQVAPYNVYVRGEEGQQAKAMAARGWQSVDEIMDDEWPKAEAKFSKIIYDAV